MKKISLLLLSAFTFSLLHSQTETEKSNCENLYYYGGTEICLPKFMGKTECYSESIIKETLHYLLGDNGMSIMGFYLPDDIYEKLYDFDRIPFNGVFVIYAQENMKYVTGDEKQLDIVATMMKSTFPEIHIDINDFLSDKVLAKYDKPVLLDNYSPNAKARSLVLMSYLDNGDNNYISVIVMNMMILKKKLITLGYYDIYKDNSSIEKARAMNDYIVLRFLSENN